MNSPSGAAERDLHAAIMNLRGHVEHDWTMNERACYRIGHRDARHAAAELVAAASAGRNELVEALERIVAIENEDFGPDWAEIEKARAIARAALAKHKGV